MTRTKLLPRLAAILLLLLGAQHVYLVLHLYFAGAPLAAQDATRQIFTRSGALRAMAAALPLHCALIVTLIAAHFAGEKQKAAVKADPRFVNRMLLLRAAALPPEVAALSKKRKRTHALMLALTFLAAAPGALYLARYRAAAPENIEQALIAMLLHVTPWAAVSMALTYLAGVLWDSALKEENRLLLKAPKGPARRVPEGARLPWYAYAAIYLLAALLIALGAVNGGLRDVLVKAINICTECIGLG